MPRVLPGCPLVLKCNVNHIKIASFKQTVRMLKCSDVNQKKQVYLSEGLPIGVEEQFMELKCPKRPPW